MKRGVEILIFLSLSIFLVQGIYAVEESCFITDKTTCLSEGNTVVMGLSDPTNAHGELANESNYDYALCCNFPGNLACNGDNEIIGLSSATNAHAEEHDLPNYPVNICYGELSDCRSAVGSCNSYEIGILALSDSTDAHIGSIGDSGYNEYNICCTPPDTIISSLFWSDSLDNKIIEANISIGISTIKMNLENEDLTVGTNVLFELFENDPFFDDDIMSVTETVSTNGSVSSEWAITQEDLDKTPNDYKEFYFKIGEDSSNLLNLNIIVEEGFTCANVVTCGNYVDEGNCGSDTTLCQVAPNGVPEGIDCSNPAITCQCVWATDVCETTYSEQEEGEIGSYGSCIVGEETVDENGCDDGFLTTSLAGTWIWNEEENPDHLDPDGKKAQCEEVGTKVIECPAQIKLPFFGFYNIITTTLIIAMAYLFIISRRKKRH